jgi:hypothetical protein
MPDPAQLSKRTQLDLRRLASKKIEEKEEGDKNEKVQK